MNKRIILKDGKKLYLVENPSLVENVKILGRSKTFRENSTEFYCRQS